MSGSGSELSGSGSELSSSGGELSGFGSELFSSGGELSGSGSELSSSGGELSGSSGELSGSGGELSSSGGELSSYSGELFAVRFQGRARTERTGREPTCKGYIQYHEKDFALINMDKEHQYFTLSLCLYAGSLSQRAENHCKVTVSLTAIHCDSSVKHTLNVQLLMRLCTG